MQNKEIQFVEHLEELRKRLMITLGAFIVFLVVAFMFVQDIYNWLVRDLGEKLAVLGPSDILWVYMMLSGVIALAGTIPVAAYQVWKFVAPALIEREREVTLRFIPGFFILFILGIAFGYFVLFPIVLSFLLGLSEGQFQTMFTAEKYFGFIINLTLPFGLLFEMPLVVLFLTRLGILNPMRLVKARKLSYFILIVVSILITPPDFISDFLVIIPLLTLYEVSLTLSKLVYRKKLKEELAIQAAEFS